MGIQKVLCYGAIAASLAITAATSASASILVSFDENGNGSWQDTGSATQNGYEGTGGALQFTTGTDPTGSVGGNVLIYQLPELVISGAVDVGEAGDTVGSTDSNASDVLFFTNSHGINDHGLDANLMIFYSDDVGGGMLADTGLPSFAGSLLDIADENGSGAFQWLPDGGTFPVGNEYDGLSAETPEPASMALVGIGLVGLAFAARKRRSA